MGQRVIPSHTLKEMQKKKKGKKKATPYWLLKFYQDAHIIYTLQIEMHGPSCLMCIGR
jgi:hypothetical protein